MLELEPENRLQAQIKVIGVGGGGGNALNTMIRSNLSGVEFLAANTDAQALEHNEAPCRLQLGTAVTRGLGCGANPERGREAAHEDRERLREALSGSDMVFITAGLGGGTGTGAAPVIAEVAREVGALTVAVVTKPFPFEGRVRMKHAEKGLDQLHDVVDTLITIPNQRLLALAGKDTAIMDAFKLADEVLLNAVKGISDLITVHGLINLDFADVRTIMNEMGMALMGAGVGSGDERASDAALAAISSPLLEDLSIDGARGVLINISGGLDLSLSDVNEASTIIQEAAHQDANIIFGAVIDESVPEGELRVTVIATGLDDGRAPRRRGDDIEIKEMGWHTSTDEVDLEGSNITLLRPEDVSSILNEESNLEEEPAQGSLIPERSLTSTGEQLSKAERTLSVDAEEKEFVSPFSEDELDVPAFIRRKRRESDDPDEPAFLREAAD
jgi:cell division protein FtsZ